MSSEQTANREHTNLEQTWRPGSDWGTGALLKGTSVVSCWYWKVPKQVANLQPLS